MIEPNTRGMREFTEADEGITVVDINDNPVGVVTAVEDGTAYVGLDPGLVDAIKSNLGFGESGEANTYALREEMVDRVTDERVRLRGDHVAE